MNDRDYKFVDLELAELVLKRFREDLKVFSTLADDETDVSYNEVGALRIIRETYLRVFIFTNGNMRINFAKNKQKKPIVSFANQRRCSGWWFSVRLCRASGFHAPDTIIKRPLKDMVKLWEEHLRKAKMWHALNKLSEIKETAPASIAS